MKTTFLLFAFIWCVCIAAGAQVIDVFPANHTSVTTAAESYITASGLVPAAGSLTVTAPIKFLVSADGVSWDFTATIPYTGGSLTSRPVYVEYAGPAGFSTTGFASISGGGASDAQVCLCANMVSCPCSTTGVIMLTGNEPVTIYPNPAAESITITSSTTIHAITITDLLGQTVCNSSYNAIQVLVNVSALSAGVYFIRINDTDVRKFVKD